MKGGFVTLRELVRIAWPLALAQLVSAVNCIWDRFQLARCGEIPLSASLSASMVAVMCVAMFAATAGYSSVFVSQFHGGGKSREAVKAFAQGVYLALASLPLLLLVTFAAGVAVDWVSTSEAIAASEKSYLRVFVPGGIFTVLNAVMSGFLSGQTRTRPSRSTIFSTASSARFPTASAFSADVAKAPTSAPSLMNGRRLTRDRV